jgi:hypothetical protein
VIGKDHRHKTRLAQNARVAGGNSRHALDDGVVSGAVAVGTVAAKAREIADDETRVARAQRLARKPKPRERGLPDVGDENIGGGEQPLEQFARRLLFEVECKRALVAVEMGELAGELSAPGRTSEAAQQIAARRLDLDDVGAVIGKKQGRGGADHDRGEIDYPDTVKRRAHVFCSSATT